MPRYYENLGVWSSSMRHPRKLPRRSSLDYVLYAVSVLCLSSIIVAIKCLPADDDYQRMFIPSEPSSSQTRRLVMHAPPTMVQLHHTLDTVTPLSVNSTSTHMIHDRRNRFWVNHGVTSHPPKDEREEGCQAMEKWQDALHPSCNSFHEVDLNAFVDHANTEQLRVVGSGLYRSVWMTREYDGTQIALKTLRYRSKKQEKYELLSVKSYEVGFTPRCMEQQRVDAVVLDQLSASPRVANIYGYCSTSALVEYADGGENLEDFLEEKHSKEERLKVACDVASAVADAHLVNSEGFATTAHTDLKPDQFLLIGGEYKLNDFNRAKLIPLNPVKKKPCSIQTEIAWKAMYQSPEEHRGVPQSEKVDVFTLGLVLFELLTRGEDLFPGMKKRERRDYVTAGGVPKIPDKKTRISKHPYETAMRKAIEKCFTFDPMERPSAREIADLLHGALKQLERK